MSLWKMWYVHCEAWQQQSPDCVQQGPWGDTGYEARRFAKKAGWVRVDPREISSLRGPFGRGTVAIDLCPACAKLLGVES